MLILQYPFMKWALLLCLGLAGIHTYLGYHVVRRGVIFVDLCLAQVAALGASVGLLLGWGENQSGKNYALSLAFTLAGAVLIAGFRRARRVPIEALIGITYAGAIAGALLVLEKSATGTEELKEMLEGALLTVPPREVVAAIGLYAAVGAVHWAFRKRLFLVTEAPEAAKAKGMRLWAWDIFFYTTFGLAVTSSVKVAGVLMVFAFLIVPAVSAMLAARGARGRILYGWAFGMVGCVAGLELSLRMDWPAGPSIVCVFIVLLLLSAVAGRLRGGDAPAAAGGH